MSSYHTSFKYLGVSSLAKNLVITHFDADQGESETGLSVESVYSQASDGTHRNLYGTKYAEPEPIRITVIKQDGTDLTISENRDILKWLTGSKTDTWMEMYIGDEMRYRLLGHVQNVLQYKMDARIVGLTILFESAAPWAFSALQTITQEAIYQTRNITISCPSDDLYTFVPMKTTFTNATDNPNGSLIITNNRIDGDVTINNLASEETVILSSANQVISSSARSIVGNDFNYNWPRLVSGENIITVEGTGDITFEYSYYIKIGDMATDINAETGKICDDEGHIIIDTLDWSRITNTPNTLAGYGIQDVYTNIEIDNKFKNITVTDVDINQTALTNMLAEVLV